MAIPRHRDGARIRIDRALKAALTEAVCWFLAAVIGFAGIGSLVLMAIGGIARCKGLC